MAWKIQHGIKNNGFFDGSSFDSHVYVSDLAIYSIRALVQYFAKFRDDERYRASLAYDTNFSKRVNFVV